MMNNTQRKLKFRDRIENGKILLNEEGEFPKDLIIQGRHTIKRYRIVRTKTGKFQLNK